MMPIKDAKDLHADITKLLLALEVARESAEKNTQDQVITVEVGGGAF
jgi:hypothetical protein